MSVWSFAFLSRVRCYLRRVGVLRALRNARELHWKRMELDQRVRWVVYDVTMREGAPPLASQLAIFLDMPLDDVRASLQRLASARMLVMQEGEILMAGPFSAVPTPFRVTTSEFSCYGNCIWDAL